MCDSESFCPCVSIYYANMFQILHNTVVDTSVVFPHKMGPPFKRALKFLAADHLKRIIQNDGKCLRFWKEPLYTLIKFEPLYAGLEYFFFSHFRICPIVSNSQAIPQSAV